MAEEHDAWLQGIGVNLPPPAGSSPPSPGPSPDVKALKVKIRAALGRAQNAMERKTIKT
jgi:hypothetical protein